VFYVKLYVHLLVDKFKLLIYLYFIAFKNHTNGAKGGPAGKQWVGEIGREKAAG